MTSPLAPNLHYTLLARLWQADRVQIIFLSPEPIALGREVLPSDEPVTSDRCTPLGLSLHQALQPYLTDANQWWCWANSFGLPLANIPNLQQFLMALSAFINTNFKLGRGQLQPGIEKEVTGRHQFILETEQEIRRLGA